MTISYVHVIMSDITVSLLTVIFCIKAANGAGTYENQFELKPHNLNKRLVGHTVIEYSVPAHHDCARECMSLKVCKSIDYHIKEKTCKLNDVDSLSVDEAEFEVKSGAVFSDITEWPTIMANKCGSRPCTDKQKCVTNGEKYTCIDVDCGLPEIENGKAFLQQPGGCLFGNKATVTCEPGYYITRDTTIVRQHTGIWKDVPTCAEASDCVDVLKLKPLAKSGVYDIKLSGKIIKVYCDMDTGGGGWTVFQKRFDGSVGFYRNLADYEKRFGDLYGEFWLGLKTTQQMLIHGTSTLRIDVLTATNRAAYLRGSDFRLYDGNKYRLKTGTVTSHPAMGNPLATNTGRPFTTKDRDWDTHRNTNCAKAYHSAWWFSSCSQMNLNGIYEVPGRKSRVYAGNGGMILRAVDGYKSLKRSKMMFRRE